MANEWNKPAFVEFETMLRRHLRRGAAPVAACAGFDLDAASAYLEGALGESHRASYESHLAGCAVCRRHLIGLARLEQTTPRFEAQPAPAPDRISAWDRWKESVTGWFDLSTWNLKWQIAGAAGAAFAILIAALGVQSWRHVTKRDAAAVSPPSASPAAVADSGFYTPQSPIAEPSPPNDQLLVGGALIARQEEQPRRTSVPVPPVRLKDGQPTVPLAPSNSSLNFPSSQTVEAPPPNPRLDARAEAQERRDSALQRPQGAPTPSANNLNNISGPYLAVLRGQSTPADLAAQSQINNNEIDAGITPQFGPRQANTEPNPTRTRGKIEKLTPLILPNRIRKAISALVPFSDSDPKQEPDRKPKVDDPNGESSKPMIRRMRGKVFHFDKGMWIDQEYKPEMQEWRRWTLARGSDQYKRVLADEPQLKEFFDLGPILIVWKNRIYKVLK
ncbi:MAG TPA: zf-HC2 domain-containing protein [Blastocatellia bacterium]|nr:zf-HC2 domain-containing protein [Blastocatellia bacterium]